MNSKIAALLLFIAVSGYGQWSTTPYTQDAIFACPGFSSRIVTYPDGSAIVIGIGDNNEIWMQKLDPNGYKQWLPWISVFSSISGLRYFLPDDDGGIYAIIGSQAQRVDKNGHLQWGENGKTIISPGTNLHRVVKDGDHGFIAIYNHFDFLQRTTVFRYDSSGTKLWEKEIDTSTVQGSFYGDIIARLKKNILIYSSKSGYRILAGDSLYGYAIHDSIKTGLFLTVVGDSVAYDFRFLSVFYDSLGKKYWRSQINKYDSNYNLIWANQFDLETQDISTLTGSYEHLAPDGFGGVFFHRSFVNTKDTSYTQILRVRDDGSTWQNSILIKNEVGVFPFYTKGQFGFVFQSEKAQKFDTSGITMWDSSITVIKDKDNSYFEDGHSDFNGGAIVTFWTVAGGIKAQHTGRVGKVGVLTKVLEHKNIVERFELYQNYPNPFNSTTNIKYSLPKDSFTEIILYDALGRRIQTLFNGIKEKGTYTEQITMNNLSSGVYFYTIKTLNLTKTRKLILLK